MNTETDELSFSQKITVGFRLETRIILPAHGSVPGNGGTGASTVTQMGFGIGEPAQQVRRSCLTAWRALSARLGLLHASRSVPTWWPV
jgi:hypothetical protein